MKLPINKIAHLIGMQNQYLGHAVYEGRVTGEVVKGGNYHHDESWVDTESVKDYLKWKKETCRISTENYEIFIKAIYEIELKEIK